MSILSFLRLIFYIIQVKIAWCGPDDFKGKVDLSWPLDDTRSTLPFTKHFNYTNIVEHKGSDGSWFAMKEFCTGEHAGTHIDAPYHFSEYGWKLGEIPLERFFTKGVVVDVSEEVARNGPDFELTEVFLKAWEKKNGVIPQKAVVLIRFGWTKRFRNENADVGVETAQKSPGISLGAARHLVNRKVYGVGVDTPSLERGSSPTFDAHKLLSSNQIYGLENVNIVDNLPVRGVSLIILPINLKNGTGGPVRIIAYPKTVLNSICCNLN